MNIDEYYEQQGNGPPIVFIHGSYATTSIWKKMVAQLASNHHCISIKLPGHCGTADPEDFSNPTINTELDILEEVITKLTDKPVHLVGHSFGGVVALAFALKGRMALSQLTLFEPVAVWVLERMQDNKMTPVVQSFLAKYFHEVSINTPYVCGQVIDFWGGNGAFESLPAFIKESMEPLVANNVRHWEICAGIESKISDLKNLSTPTRIICGTESNPVAHAIADHLNTNILLSKKYIVDGASHFLVTSHGSECFAALNDQAILDDI
ncbi:MAG: pimeloyl-ACP methyl ester carboxylesterase [Oleiphilaceae bacterium]|jgi:pimeloyl-ACP methyl ester carboxylesterase